LSIFAGIIWIEWKDDFLQEIRDRIEHEKGGFLKSSMTAVVGILIKLVNTIIQKFL
jgi:hypothetical protein